MDFCSYLEGTEQIQNTLYIFNDIEFGKGIDSKSAITQKVKKDFSAALKNGLARGERSATNYKRTTPLITRGRSLKFNYDTNGNVIIKWVNGITFKVVIGEFKNSLELNSTLHKIINNEYKLGQSSLYFNKKNELILILTLSGTKISIQPKIADAVTAQSFSIIACRRSHFTLPKTAFNSAPSNTSPSKFIS